MKTIAYENSLKKSGILKTVKTEPAPGKDLLVLPDIPAVRQARELFASNTNSTPFITTFGLMAQKHNLYRPDRKQILSRTGRAILMLQTLENRFAGTSQTTEGRMEKMDRTKLCAELLRLNAGMKQSGVSASSITKKGKRKLPPGTPAKLSEIEPVLTDFETQMKTGGMIDDTDVITELAKAVEKGDAREVNGKISRIIAAGFHALTPSQLKVMEAAEKAGISALLLTRETARKNTVKPSAKGAKISLTSFPSISNEAEFAACEIRKMIDRGNKIEDFAVIVRNSFSAGSVIADAFERNGVPLSLRSGTSLGSASEISVFLKDTFAAAQAGCCGKEFIRLLRNPALKTFFSQTGNILKAVSEMESGIEKTGSHGETKNVRFERMTEPLRGKRNYEKALEKITGLREIISARFPVNDTPVKTKTMFSALAFVVDKTLAGKNGSPQDGSLEEAREFLREAVFLSEKWGCETESAEEFSRFANYLMSGRSFSRTTRTDGPCVPVMNTLEARGTSYPVVFVLDFSEQSFPQAPPAGFILNDEEKRLINECCGSQAFATDETHFKDERLIWKTVAACADKELRLSFSRSGAGTGGRKSCSRFIEELGEISPIETGEKQYPDFPASGVYSPQTAMAEAFASGGEIPDDLEKLLREKDKFFRLSGRIGAGFAAEKERLRPEAEFSGFEGIVLKTENRRREKLRVTDIEKFGTCPFKFFCSNVLGIKESPEDGEMPSAADTGKLYHSALKHFFSGDAGSKMWETGSGETLETLSEFLDSQQTENFRRAVSGHVWELQKERTLKFVGKFLEFEKKRIRDEKLTPELFEQTVRLEIDGTEIRGRFDRMDITGEGGARVVDYKKGSVKSKNICDRENLQIPLYLAQISEELKITPESGAYLSVEKPWEIKETGMQSGADSQIDKAKRFARDCISLINKGFFAAIPVKKPDGFPYLKTVIRKPDRPCGLCSWNDICRVKDGVVRTAEDK